MWIIYLLPLSLSRFYSLRLSAFLAYVSLFASVIGSGGSVGWGLLRRLADLLYTISIWLEYGLRPLIPLLLGLSFSLLPYSVSWLHSHSLIIQGNGVDLTAIFFQYVLPGAVVAAIGALTGYFANKRTQRKEDIEYWEEQAKDLRSEFDRLKVELSAVKGQNLRYELAFMYIRNEPDSNPVMIRTAQAIIDGNISYIRRRGDEGRGDITEAHP